MKIKITNKIKNQILGALDANIELEGLHIHFEKEHEVTESSLKNAEGDPVPPRVPPVPPLT